MDNNRIVLSTVVKRKQVSYCLYDMLTRLFNNIINLSCHEQKFLVRLCFYFC